MIRIACIALLAVGSIAAADTKRLAVTADVGICAHPSEIHNNTGARTGIRIKGNEHYYLFDFDARAVRNWQITAATLHLKLRRGNIRRVAICTVPVSWTEGTATGKPQDGSPCFTHRQYPRVTWTPGGGTMTDATFNSPHMLWRAANVKVEAGWLKIPVAPELVQAVAAGLSHGLALGEETGQTRENHDIYSREQSNARPYLVVEGRPHHVAAFLKRPPAKAKAFPPAAGVRVGSLAVDTRWPGKKLLGSRVTLRQPLATAGFRTIERVTFGDLPLVFDHLPADGGPRWRVTVASFVGPQAYQAESGWVGPSATVAAPSLPVLPRQRTLTPRATNGWRLRLLPGTAKPAPTGPTAAVPISAPITASNAWAAFQAVVMPPRGKAAGVTISLDSLAYVGTPMMTSMPKPVLTNIKLYRTWYVSAGRTPHAEVLVPIVPGRPIEIPWGANAVAAQTCQPIFIDVWIPKGAWPGPYAGMLSVKEAGKLVASVEVRLTVSLVALPDTFEIVGDMNTYSSPARAMGVSSASPDAYVAAERKYYRLAHAHRMTLNVLPYSQSGSINWRGAPIVSGRGADCRVTDWRQWDQRFAPLLSGQAFSAASGYVGPGAGVPIRHIYLPLHENWPVKLAESFRPWPPPRDYQKLLAWSAELPDVEKCFRGDHAAAWQSVLRQFRAHLTAKGWTRTRCQVYLNNKHYFRNPKQGGRGVSLWLLDEPMFADDFRALAYFGRLTRDASSGLAASPAIDYRIDISRPTHQRQWLDGVVDLNVCAGQFHGQRRLIAYRKRTFGEVYWNYRMPPSFSADNLGWALWPVRSYCWGAVGTLPWQTIASDGDLRAADATALMYPGRKFGIDEPVPSLRMKAWRDGLQTAELLRMLRIKRGWTDVQLRAWVGQVCDLSGWRDGMDPAADAAIVTFATMTAARLVRLQHAALVALAAK